MKKYNSIDFTKFIMAICVVAIHTQPLINCKNELANSIYDTFVALAVPFFFIASGFLLANKFDDEFATDKNFINVKKTLFHIVRLYLLWTSIYLPITIFHFLSLGNSFFRNVLSFLKGFIFIGEQYNSWHLWYLLSTIYTLILLLLLIKLRCTKKILLILASIFFLASCAISYLVSIENITSSAAYYIQRFFVLSIGNGRILKGAFYLPIGILLRQRQLKSSQSLFLLVVGFILSTYIRVYMLKEVFIALTAIAFFEFVLSIDFSDSAIYSYMRKMSGVVYFIHMYVWTIYYMIVYNKKTYGLDCFIITTGISLFLAFIYVSIRNNRLKTNANSGT